MNPLIARIKNESVYDSAMHVSWLSISFRITCTWQSVITTDEQLHHDNMKYGEPYPALDFLENVTSGLNTLSTLFMTDRCRRRLSARQRCLLFARICLPVIWFPSPFCLCHIRAKLVNHLRFVQILSIQVMFESVHCGSLADSMTLYLTSNAADLL